MSIKATLSSDGLEEFYTAPTLKEMCLYKCLKNKDILTTEVEVDEDMDGSEKLDWEKFRLKEPIQRDLVVALLKAGEKFLFALTPQYEPVLAAIRMSQPEHLVKVHVNNTATLKDRQLEWLISGGNVQSLDINSCTSLGSGSLVAINKFGNKLQYLKIGNSRRVLPSPLDWKDNSAILRTPNLKTFIVSGINDRYRHRNSPNIDNYWRCLVQNFISNLEDLQMNDIGKFETLEFLEPARNKLSSLTLRSCSVTENTNAWACLFKLEKLRFLDVIDSCIGEAFFGEDVVQRLLIAKPNLESLAVDSGLVKDIHVDTSIRGQRPLAKRLEFLGIMDKDEYSTDESEVRKAKLLAKDVAYFGTMEGELRVLEYFSNQLNACSFNVTLELLLEGLLTGVAVVPWKTVAVFALLMKTIQNIGVDVEYANAFIQYWKLLLTPDIWGNLGEVLQHQYIGAIFAYMSRWSVVMDSHRHPDEDNLSSEEMISKVIDIIMNLEGGLRFDHYLTLVPMVIRVAERTITKSSTMEDGVRIEISVFRRMMERFKDLLRKIAQLLENAVDRFPGEINALWGISSVVVVTGNLMEFSSVVPRYHRIDLMEALSSMIKSLRKLCLNSGPRRAAFHSAEGIGIVMDWLTLIIDWSLGGLADRESFALLEILEIILQDTKINLSESGTITADLEKLLLSLYSRWEFRNSNPVRWTTPYSLSERIASLLNIVETDPRYDYEPIADVKKIMMKFK